MPTYTNRERECFRRPNCRGFPVRHFHSHFDESGAVQFDSYSFPDYLSREDEFLKHCIVYCRQSATGERERGEGVGERERGEGVREREGREWGREKGVERGRRWGKGKAEGGRE